MHNIGGSCGTEVAEAAYGALGTHFGLGGPQERVRRLARESRGPGRKSLLASVDVGSALVAFLSTSLSPGGVCEGRPTS